MFSHSLRVHIVNLINGQKLFSWNVIELLLIKLKLFQSGELFLNSKRASPYCPSCGWPFQESTSIWACCGILRWIQSFVTQNKFAHLDYLLRGVHAFWYWVINIKADLSERLHGCRSRHIPDWLLGQDNGLRIFDELWMRVSVDTYQIGCCLTLLYILAIQCSIFFSVGDLIQNFPAKASYSLRQSPEQTSLLSLFFSRLILTSYLVFVD